MNISFENKNRMNAMYYRDGLSNLEIAHLMEMKLSFVDRYIESVARRIEKGEITKESIINGCNHLKVPLTKKPQMSLDDFEVVEITPKNKGRIKRIPTFEKIIEDYNAGLLSLVSFSVNFLDDTYVITLKEVKQ